MTCFCLFLCRVLQRPIVHKHVDLLVFLKELEEIGVVVRGVVVVVVAGVSGLREQLP